jgi:hypothetical protein
MLCKDYEDLLLILMPWYKASWLQSLGAASLPQAKVVIDSVFFVEVKSAFEKLNTGKVRGKKIVVEI